MSPFRYSKVSSESSEDSPIEFPQTNYRRSRCSTAIEKLGYLRWPVTFALLSIILFSQWSILRSRPHGLVAGREFNEIVPTCRFLSASQGQPGSITPISTHQQIFRSDKRYRSDHKTIASINATKQEWENLLPLGAGFMEVPNYASHQLPPPMHFPQAPGKEVYSLAIFHELHCLMHIAASMDDLVMQLRNHDFTVDEAVLLHNDHCFDYIRNAIMCFGDTTLEGQTRTPGISHVPGTDGTGAIHVCRNFDEISAYAERKRLNSAKEHLF